LGSPFYLASRFRDEADTRFLLDPKALRNHFIFLPFGRPPEVKGLIDGSKVSRTINYVVPVFEAADFSIEEEPGEWESISARGGSGKSENEINEPARFLGLGGGHHMWISARSGAHCRVLCLAPNGQLEIESRQTTDLVEGEMVIERIGGSSPSLIDSVADGLGARRLRASQSIWKEGLRHKIAEMGSLRAAEKILSAEYGVDVMNLRHWAFGARSIAPNSKDDFVKVCNFIGLSESADHLWAS